MKPGKSLYLRAGTVLAGLLLLAITLPQTFYAIDETEYGLALRFGEVQAVHREPGLRLKAPFIDTVQRIDRRTLRADIPPREVPDQDKERLIIDIVLRYRISDPLEFRKQLRNEATALERLETITYSAMRDTIAEYDRTEVIGARPLLDNQGQAVVDADGIPVYEQLTATRDRIDRQIQNRIATDIQAQNYGIELLTADIKRADFPPQIKDAIVARLQEERNRVAAAHRAAGEENYLKTIAAVDAEVAEILAAARQTARRVRGEADAAAIRLVREALTANPEFYRFQRTLESYRLTLQQGATVIATGQAGSYFAQLMNPPAGTPEKSGAAPKDREWNQGTDSAPSAAGGVKEQPNEN